MEHTLDQFGKEKITPHPTRTAAIVLAAGQGKRMKSKIQKQFLLLEEKPVIWYALHAFEESRVDDVILVTGADEIAYCRGRDCRKIWIFQGARYRLQAEKSATIRSTEV